MNRAVFSSKLMGEKNSGDVLHDAISVVQRFVCALEEGRLLRPSLSASLPVLERESDRLFLEGMLFKLARRLDRKGELSALAGRVGVSRAVEFLARQRLKERTLRPELASLVGRSILRDLAHDRGLSADTMRRRVRRAIGLSPRTLRQRQRICQAIDQIQGGMKISAAAHECGYRSESSFFAAFRKATGLSPAAVRALSPEEVADLRQKLMPWVRTG